MDNTGEVSQQSVDRMLFILDRESQELARFLVDEEITPSELIHPLLTANVITTAHVQAVLTLDHSTYDKYLGLLKDVETVIATSNSNGFLNDTATIVRSFISILLDYNLHRIAHRLHPDLATANITSDTMQNGSVSVPVEDPHLHTYDTPVALLEPNSTPSSPASSTAGQRCSEGNTSYFTASSGDAASPNMRLSESCSSLGNGQCGAPCSGAAVPESASYDGNIGTTPAQQAMQIVVEYNNKVFGPLEGEPADDDKYHNSSKPRGLVFLANYSSFKNDDHTHREGSDVDVKNLHSLFEQMGYVVPDIHQDMTKAETLTALRKFRDDERHKLAHSCIVIIMSHGKDNSNFYTSDGLSVSIEEVLERFSNRECKALIDKPKLFILQYCRGDRRDMGVPPLSNVSRAITEILQTDSARLGHTRAFSNKPTFSDMLLLYSTIEGYVSYRHPQHGSWFIKALCQVFMRHACVCTLDQLLKKVSKLVNEHESEDGRKQSCDIRIISFNKDFYFNPTTTFDETRAPCVGRDGSSGSKPNPNRLTVGSGEGDGDMVLQGPTVGSSDGDLVVGDCFLGVIGVAKDVAPSNTTSPGDLLVKQTLDDHSNGLVKEAHTNQFNSNNPPLDVFTFQQMVNSLPTLPNNYDVILQTCPSPAVLDFNCKLSAEDEPEFDDSGIISSSSEFSSLGGAYGSISSEESEGVGRANSTLIMTEPSGSGEGSRHQGNRMYSSSSEPEVCYPPPKSFIRRDSELSVSLNLAVDDADVDSRVFGSFEDNLMDA